MGSGSAFEGDGYVDKKEGAPAEVVAGAVMSEKGAVVEEQATFNHPLLQFFSYTHLPPEKQAISAPFQKLAKALLVTLPPNAQTTRALEKLIEAKDCAVRASIMRH